MIPRRCRTRRVGVDQIDELIRKYRRDLRERELRDQKRHDDLMDLMKQLQRKMAHDR